MSGLLFGAVALAELGTFAHDFEAKYGAKPIDLNIGRTYPPLVFDYIDSYGVSGRTAYLRGFVPLDTAFPLLGGCLNAFITGWLSKVTRGVAGPWQLVFVPLASWLLDWTENVFFVALCLNHPERAVVVAWIGYMVSLSKLATLAASFVVIALMACRALSTCRLRREHGEPLAGKGQGLLQS